MPPPTRAQVHHPRHQLEQARAALDAHVEASPMRVRIEQRRLDCVNASSGSWVSACRKSSVSARACAAPAFIWRARPRGACSTLVGQRLGGCDGGIGATTVDDDHFRTAIAQCCQCSQAGVDPRRFVERRYDDAQARDHRCDRRCAIRPPAARHRSCCLVRPCSHSNGRRRGCRAAIGAVLQQVGAVARAAGRAAASADRASG